MAVCKLCNAIMEGGGQPLPYVMVQMECKIVILADIIKSPEHFRAKQFNKIYM